MSVKTPLNFSPLSLDFLNFSCITHIAFVKESIQQTFTNCVDYNRVPNMHTNGARRQRKFVHCIDSSA